jgi:release factor glutamine methyltransferase
LEKKNLKPKELFDRSLIALPNFYSKEEKRGLVIALFEHFLGLNPNDLITNEKEIPIEEGPFKEFVDAQTRINQGVPLQYVIGKSDFLGLSLKVGSGVLIPRPETEELAQWASDELSSSEGNILDIGTGSGCLAIFLKKSNPLLKVHAIDNSADALAIASMNAKENGTEVEFHLKDILKESPDFLDLRCIISNPPYVSEKDKKGLRPNVIDHEPWEALFPPGKDELIFYRRIRDIGEMILKDQGLIFLEIPESRASKIADLFFEKCWAKPEIKKDVFGKERMIRVQYLGS